MKKLLLVLTVFFSFSTLSIAQPSDPKGDHQDRQAESSRQHKESRDDKRYPPKRYYYNDNEGRYYSRIYLRNHRNVLCNDGETVRAKNKNACKFHGGAQYYW